MAPVKTTYNCYCNVRVCCDCYSIEGKLS